MYLSTRNLLFRESAAPQNDGALLYENRTRNDTISQIQQSRDIAPKSSKLTEIIEAFLSYEEHYFRYVKKCQKVGEYAPDDICGEMDPLQTGRSRISAIGKEFSPLMDRRYRRWEITSAQRRMALLVDQSVAFFKKYFDTLTADALKRSPYATTKDGEEIGESVSNAADIIDAGRKERFDMGAHARNSTEKTTAQVFRCMASTAETKLCVDLQNDVVEK